MERVAITVSGMVQGVGFRPYVYRLAREMGLRGFVRNTADGVLIELEGEGRGEFIDRLKSGAPPLARIMGLDFREIPAGDTAYADFKILDSEREGDFTAWASPDVSVCPDCLRELSDPSDRRYLYPFINCTNCGPRYSIIREIPYDRGNTTMSRFTMCPECRREYKDAGDRRFHAEPVACPACGPSLSMVPPVSTEPDGASETAPPGGAVTLAVRELERGCILAIKGLGGFHLACDAMNAKAVSRLRLGKNRGNKPFALMARSVAAIKKFCHMSPDEEQKLLSPERPVVLLRKKEPCALPSAIAPGNGRLGFMLPYTPLHWLLFNPGGNGASPSAFSALVMTSGNRAGEPIAAGNEEALKRLSGVADCFVLHDRDIHTRVDDSVAYQVSPVNDRPFFAFARRARGYVPAPVDIGKAGAQVLGAGGDLKNTFTLTKDGRAIMSQHIGDMESPGAQALYLETLEKIKRLFRVRPEAAGYDMHPGYHSSDLVLGLDIPRKFAIQHHYAHVASVMAETACTDEVIGVALDGTGYGTDGTLWGGEFLIAGLNGFERAAFFKPIPLPGGVAAVKEPWRAAIGLLISSFPEGDVLALAQKSGIIGRRAGEEVEKVLAVSKRPGLSPLSSGAGRIFEAFSSILGLVDSNTFEAEAAIALESVAEDTKEEYHYDTSAGGRQLDFSAAFARAIEDKAAGVRPGLMSAKFHNMVARAVSDTALRLSAETGINKIVLSGGVFQNRRLLEGVMDRLSLSLRGEVSVHTNMLVPPGDGGISLGQAFIVRERVSN